MKTIRIYMSYNWQHPDWPNFTYNLSDAVQKQIDNYDKEARRVGDTFTQIDTHAQRQSLTDLLVTEALTTSAIEKEYFADADMRAAVQIELELFADPANIGINDSRAIGMAKLMVDTRKNFDAPLSADMMFEWHELIL